MDKKGINQEDRKEAGAQEHQHDDDFDSLLDDCA